MRGGWALIGIAVLGVLVMLAVLAGLLWVTHESIERGDYAKAAVAALVFLGLVSGGNSTTRRPA